MSTSFPGLFPFELIGSAAQLIQKGKALGTRLFLCVGFYCIQPNFILKRSHITFCKTLHSLRPTCSNLELKIILKV